MLSYHVFSNTNKGKVDLEAVVAKSLLIYYLNTALYFVSK